MSPSTNPFEHAVVLTVAGGLGPQDKLGAHDQAAFYFPVHAVEDRRGNILVSDSRNHKIKRVTPGHDVELVAGGAPGRVDGDLSTARFGEPTYMALADDDSILVSDRRERVVRRVIEAVRVETAAGTPEMPYLESAKDYVFTIDHRGRIDYTREEWEQAKDDFSFEYFDGDKQIARFASPAGLAFTPAGDLLIVDERNSVIRKLDRRGQVSTLAGRHERDSWGERGSSDGHGADATFQGPLGICPDGRGGFIVTEDSNPGVRCMDAEGNVVTRFREKADWPRLGRLGAPASVVSDRHGNIIMACVYQNRLACLTPQGEWYYLGTLEPGYVDGRSSEVRFSQPGGLSLDRHGNLVVADSGNHGIRRVILNPSDELLAGLPAPGGATERLLFEAEAPTSVARSRSHLPPVSSWRQLLGRRIEFVEKGSIPDGMVLNLGDMEARIRGVGDDPVPYFANDHRGHDFHGFSYHVRGQVVHGLRLQFTNTSVEHETVEFIKIQFADGGFQYLKPHFGYGLELMSGETMLAEAAAIMQVIQSVEQPSSQEITLVLPEGRLTITSTAGAALETLSCDEYRYDLDVFNGLDESPNPFLVAQGMEPEENDLIFSIAVPALGEAISSGEQGNASEVASGPPVWKPASPQSAVGQTIVVVDMPLALPGDPIGNYMVLTLTGYSMLQFRAQGSDLVIRYESSGTRLGTGGDEHHEP